MKKMRLSSTIIILAVIQLILITAFSQAACANVVHGGKIWTLTTTIGKSINQVDAQWKGKVWNVATGVGEVNQLLSSQGLVHGKGYRPDVGGRARKLTKDLRSYANHGFWGLAKGKGNSTIMVDVILKGNTYQWTNHLVHFTHNFAKPGTTVFINQKWTPPVVKPPVVQPPSAVPVPGAVWLFGTGIAGLVARRKLGGSK